jgi:hypothetical protein
LIIGQSGSGFIQVMLRLLNFLGTRSVLQFFKISAGILGRAFRLFILCAEFIIFQPYENLAFFDVVTLFHADPGDRPVTFEFRLILW